MGGSLSMQVITFHTLSIFWSPSGRVVAPRRQEEEEEEVIITIVGMTPGQGRCCPDIEYSALIFASCSGQEAPGLTPKAPG